MLAAEGLLPAERLLTAHLLLLLLLEGVKS